jgi:uracil-DNA glycosylase
MTSLRRTTGVGYAPVAAGTAGFVARLAEARIGTTFNFYRDGAGAPLRRERLRAYLGARMHARLLLVGEAAGYRGARVSGVPFTSERQLTGAGPAEASATIVHTVLTDLGLDEEVLLWNLVPTHPHRPGKARSNRPPTQGEIAGGRPFLAELARGRRILAVGRLAQRELGAPYVRHPSHGGAVEFREGLLQSALGGRAVRRFSVQ